ncbi:cytochrome c-type protein Cgr1 [Xiamenia xianingshaonis]|uniref:Cytochrome c3 family protein n=1 Tax=Xiamenia xianingshaonis TaxID=2682776 RepID=A0A9E6MPJ3_9ACTN|nr:cytochrome c3 family protein [Xiamenia xianingshaonis]NHM14143.1 salivary glue protein Sgs-3 [Xiamenia xianingshaonis]QTU84003.1 cytochrome c3 family protein [Xiamenia xianingshaonis]
MSADETKVEAGAEATAKDSSTKEAAPQKKKKKWPIVVGIVAVVLIAAGAGFWVWHEQPSFCNAICHTPMDPYNATYDQDAGVAGIDKYGNEVASTNGMLAVTHKANESQSTCMSCHVPQISEQITEGINWVTGNYEVVKTKTGALVPTERGLDQLTAARGIAPEAFCLNEACHANDDGTAMTRKDLVAATADMERNPHLEPHGETNCSDCHKAHRASVNACSQCHQDADIPEGWLSFKDANEVAPA